MRLKKIISKPGSWSKFCAEHEHCNRLNTVRVVVDKSSRRIPSFALEWLSEVHMPPVNWQDYHYLLIVIGVTRLFATMKKQKHEFDWWLFVYKLKNIVIFCRVYRAAINDDETLTICQPNQTIKAVVPSFFVTIKR